MLVIHPTAAPTLAFTASYTDSPARLRWIREHAHAVEFSPNPRQPDHTPRMLHAFLDAGLPVRFHTRYFGYELGHADNRLAGIALDVHVKTLSTAVALGEPVVTVHTGLDPAQPVVFSRIVDNLSRLVDHAGELGITICLENLRKGHSSDPLKVMEWAEASGAMITFDVGHALGAECVRSGRHSPEDFVEMFGPRLLGVHIYGKEDAGGHHPIKDMSAFEPIIEKLLQTRCSWWTVELQDPDEALHSRALIENALHARFGKSRPSQSPAVRAGMRSSHV